MTTTVVVIFLIVYLGMILGGLPFLQLDRTGIALLGAIALITFDAHPLAGPVLALMSTLAGSLLIVGSIANIIVVDSAARQSVRIDWHRHARIGVPVTLATLAISAGYLWLQLRISG